MSGGVGNVSSRNRSPSPDAHRRRGRDEPTAFHTPSGGDGETPPAPPTDVAPVWLSAGAPRGDLLRISHVMSLGGRPADQARALAALAVYAPGEEQRRLSATLAASAGAKVRRAELSGRGGGADGGGGGGGGAGRPPSATTTDTAWVAAVAAATAVAAPAPDSLLGEAVAALAAAARAHLGDRLSRMRLDRVAALAPTAAWDDATGLGRLQPGGGGWDDGHPLAATRLGALTAGRQPGGVTPPLTAVSPPGTYPRRPPWTTPWMRGGRWRRSFRRPYRCSRAPSGHQGWMTSSGAWDLALSLPMTRPTSRRSSTGDATRG